jgi:hypothetical protein
MAHAEDVTQAAERYKEAQAARDEARDALRWTILAAVADEVPLNAVARWAGLTRTQARVLARLPKDDDGD